MRSTTTMLVVWILYFTTVCYESSEGKENHLKEEESDDLGRLYSVVSQGSVLKSRVRRATTDDEDKRSPLPRLGARAPLPRLGQRSDDEGQEEEAMDRGNFRDKRLPRFGRELSREEEEEEDGEMEKRLPRLGIRSPLPRLGARSPLPRLGEDKDKRLPRLGLRSGEIQDLEDEYESIEGGEGVEDDAENRDKRLPRFGLYRRASPFPRLGRSEDGKRAAPFPRLGRASPFPRLGRANEYYKFQEVEERAAPFPRLGRASPFPRLG